MHPHQELHRPDRTPPRTRVRSSGRSSPHTRFREAARHRDENQYPAKTAGEANGPGVETLREVRQLADKVGGIDRLRDLVYELARMSR